MNSAHTNCILRSTDMICSVHHLALTLCILRVIYSKYSCLNETQSCCVWRLSGKEFQIVGPCTVNAHRPTVEISSQCHDTTINCYLVTRFCAGIRGATTFSKLGVQFLSLGYYCPSTEKMDRSTQFGAVGYIITLYSSKKLRKKLGVRPNFGGPDPRVPSGCTHAPRTPERKRGQGWREG